MVAPLIHRFAPAARLIHRFAPAARLIHRFALAEFKDGAGAKRKNLRSVLDFASLFAIYFLTSNSASMTSSLPFAWPDCPSLEVGCWGPGPGPPPGPFPYKCCAMACEACCSSLMACLIALASSFF